MFLILYFPLSSWHDLHLILPSLVIAERRNVTWSVRENVKTQSNIVTIWIFLSSDGATHSGQFCNAQ